MKKCTYASGEHVITQGDVGSTFYYMCEGDVDIVKDGLKVARLPAGAFFGEQALITAQPRNASVVAVGECLALEMAAKDFKLVQNKARGWTMDHRGPGPNGPVRGPPAG